MSRLLGIMREHTRELWEQAQNTQKSAEELEQELADINIQTNWCYAEMIDHVTPEECSCSEHSDIGDEEETYYIKERTVDGEEVFVTVDDPEDEDLLYTKSVTAGGNEVFRPYEEPDPSEEPVPWDDITGSSDNIFGSTWTTWGSQGIRGYDGEMYAECEEGGWMELKAWLRALAKGEL